MRVKAGFHIDFDTSVKSESEIRRRLKQILKERNVASKKLFSPFIRYELELYQDDPLYLEMRDIEEKLDAEWDVDWDETMDDYEALEELCNTEDPGESVNMFGFAPEYSEDELKKAVGYMGGKQTICDLADDNCESSDWFQWCKTCRQQAEQIHPYIFKRTSKLKKLMTRRKVFGPDGYSVFVTVPMYDYLMEHGISADNFTPAYMGKRNPELAGYQITGANVLPPGAFQCEDFVPRARCRECGRIRLDTRESRYYNGEYIDQKKAGRLAPANAIYEYIGNTRWVIFSPEMYRLLAEADPDFVAWPVFPLSMKEELEQGCR